MISEPNAISAIANARVLSLNPVFASSLELLSALGCRLDFVGRGDKLAGFGLLVADGAGD